MRGRVWKGVGCYQAVAITSGRTKRRPDAPLPFASSSPPINCTQLCFLPSFHLMIIFYFPKPLSITGTSAARRGATCAWWACPLRWPLHPSPAHPPPNSLNVLHHLDLPPFALSHEQVHQQPDRAQRAHGRPVHCPGQRPGPGRLAGHWKGEHCTALLAR